MSDVLSASPRPDRTRSRHASVPYHRGRARLAVLYLRIYARGFRPAASLPASGTRRGTQALERLNAAITNFLQEVRLDA